MLPTCMCVTASSWSLQLRGWQGTGRAGYPHQWVVIGRGTVASYDGIPVEGWSLYEAHILNVALKMWSSFTKVCTALPHPLPEDGAPHRLLG